MLKRSPEFKKIVPIFGIAFVPIDLAIAQTTQPQPLPQPTTTVIDPASIMGYLALGLTAIWGVSSQLIAKWGAASVDSRQKAVQQKLEQEKGMAEVFITRTDKSAEAIESILRLSLANNFDNLRQQIELNYEYQKKITSFENVVQSLKEQVDQNVQATQILIDQNKNILKALEMRRGESCP